MPAASLWCMKVGQAHQCPTPPQIGGRPYTVETGKFRVGPGLLRIVYTSGGGDVGDTCQLSCARSFVSHKGEAVFWYLKTIPRFSKEADRVIDKLAKFQQPLSSFYF